ncbi:MAG: hypothetical protein RLZ98_422 [Pseudomonadota bacterium]|jgi:hypothetical protein
MRSWGYGLNSQATLAGGRSYRILLSKSGSLWVLRMSKPVITSLRAVAARALLAAAILLSASPASSQSLLDFLFGAPKAAPRYTPPQHLRPPSGSTLSLRDYGAPGYSPYSSPRQSYRVGGGTYRTMCVRVCDGYFFPINYRTSAGYLYRDADECSARCGANGRLFYYPSGTADISKAVDLSGLSYKSMRTAFLYRKKYDASCTCRPHPWTEAAKARHRRYAREESGETAVSEVPLPPRSVEIASADPSTVRQDAADTMQPDTGSTFDVSPVARPEPVTFTGSEPAPTSSQIARRTMPTAAARSTPRAGSTHKARPARKSSPPVRKTKSENSGFGLSWLPGPSKPKYVWPGDPR